MSLRSMGSMSRFSSIASQRGKRATISMQISANMSKSDAKRKCIMFGESSSLSEACDICIQQIRQYCFSQYNTYKQDYQMRFIGNRPEDQSWLYWFTYKTILPELPCLITHSLCAVLLIGYVYINRNNYPHRQNSPALTIIAQLALLFASLCLFLAKLNSIFYEQVQNCYNNSPKIIACNLVYTFCMQLLLALYLLRMTRVLMITFNINSRKSTTRFLIKIFKSQKILALIAISWASLIILIDAYFKYDKQTKTLSLSPQFDQFMCDEDKQQLHILNISKLIISLILFLLTFLKSSALDQISNELQFRQQYIVLFFLKLVVLLLNKIMFLINPQISSTYPVHFVDCLTNLLTGFCLLNLYFANKNQKSDLYLPTGNQRQLDRYTLFKYWQSCYALREFYLKQDRGDEFEALTEINKMDHNMEEGREMEEVIGRLRSSLHERMISERDREQLNIFESNHNRKAVFQKYISIYIELWEQTKKEWMKTKSYSYLVQKWGENKKYEERMKELGLIDIQ